MGFGVADPRCQRELNTHTCPIASADLTTRVLLFTTTFETAPISDEITPSGINMAVAFLRGQLEFHMSIVHTLPNMNEQLMMPVI